MEKKPTVKVSVQTPGGTYTPAPADLSGIGLPEGLLELSERIAANVHDVWAAGRIAEGWTWGPERNDALKQTPCLVPYDALPEEEKAYDRATSRETLSLILSLGFRLLPPQ